ncbi:MAG: LEA type 2 family protein [Pseudomonadota bacterium]|nr:LEA type 2 family protein [Pseudomonadota bacterium]
MSLLLALLAGCASTGAQRISEPASSIQQLRIDAQGQWQVELRLQNYSNVAMRFDQVDLALSIDGKPAGQLQAAPALTVAAESAEILALSLTPSLPAKLQAADALATGRGFAYQLKGTVKASTGNGKPRNYSLQRDSALSPAPGLPGVLR